MNFYHYHNDLSLEINLASVTTGQAIDPSMIKFIKFYTRKNGPTYQCCFGNNTLINNGNTVTAVLNNHGLDPGVLQYVIEFQIPDANMPDYFKKVHQYYSTEIELVKGNGETLMADVQVMFGDTIDSKFNDLNSELDEVSENVSDIQAVIVSVQEINSVQDASIARLEEIVSAIDGGASGSIDRIDTSINALSRDVSALNGSVNTLATEQETMSQNLSNVTNTVNNVSARVDGFETALANKADVSLLGNYYTTGETYTKSEVDRAIADAALDGSLPAGIVIDANYVHTDNNYTNEDKAKVRDFDLTGYVENASLVANYATKAELQSVDDNHPTNASVNTNYAKKADIAHELSNYPTNASVNTNYLKKSELANELSDYPTNTSVNTNYAKKTELEGYVTLKYAQDNLIHEVQLDNILDDYPTNASLSQNYVTWRYANENYVTYENVDELIINTVDNNYTFQNKVIDIINTSTAVKDISVINTNVSDISTALHRDYVTTQTVNADFVKNASLNTVLATKQDTLVSGTNIKTVNGESLLGTGNITIDLDLYQVVQSLPVDDINVNKIYLVASDPSVNGNEFTEYMYVNGEWEEMGTYKADVDLTNYATIDDISTFKPIVFCTQAEYDELVTNEQVDENTVYMIDSSNAINYLTPDDVSSFITIDDVSNKLEADDVSIYATITYVDTIDSSIVNYVDTQIGNIQNILQTI